MLFIVDFRHVTQMSTNQVVAATSRNIVRLSKKVPRSDKSRLLQLDKLEGDFKATINKYHTLQNVSHYFVLS